MERFLSLHRETMDHWSYCLTRDQIDMSLLSWGGVLTAVSIPPLPVLFSILKLRYDEEGFCVLKILRFLKFGAIKMLENNATPYIISAVYH